MRGLFASDGKRPSGNRTGTFRGSNRFQERFGGRIALTADIEVSGQVLTTYNLHLESKENGILRVSQLNEVLAS
jgi:hypothetical protein